MRKRQRAQGPRKGWGGFPWAERSEAFGSGALFRRFLVRRHKNRFGSLRRFAPADAKAVEGSRAPKRWRAFPCADVTEAFGVRQSSAAFSSAVTRTASDH